jgi:hypothetical protein
MPEIPAEWDDLSWRNDLCPSFAFWADDAAGQLARVWVKPAHGTAPEIAGGQRFSITVEGGLRDCDCVLQSDDWSEILAYVNCGKWRD